MTIDKSNSLPQTLFLWTNKIVLILLSNKKSIFNKKAAANMKLIKF